MRTRYYVPEALWLSMVYRFRMKHRKFAAWSKTLGESGAESPEDTACDTRVHQIGRAVDWACSHTPWESKCMVRALTAKKMLNRRGYPCTLYMGVSTDENGKMIAHAWLRLGRTYVTGGTGFGYAVTGKFGETEIKGKKK